MAFRTPNAKPNAIASSALIWVSLPFALLFGGIGIRIAYQQIQRHHWLKACAAAPFLLVGGVACVGVVYGLKAYMRQRRLEEAHPEEPWLWNSDWVNGEIPDHAVGGTIGIWIVALFANGIAIPAILNAIGKFQRAHDPTLFLAWLFPAAGLIFLIMAIRATARAAYFGKSVFAIDTLPASPGGNLAGVVRLTRPMTPTGPVRLHLTCTQRSGSGKQRILRILWQSEQHADQLPPSEIGCAIPVSFAIPPGLPNSTSAADPNAVLWQLEVNAPTAKLNYWSRFTVPVFQVTNPQS